MKYGVKRVTLVGNVGEVPRVTEREGEAFVASFPLATTEVWPDKEGEEVRFTEWHHSVLVVVTGDKGVRIVMSKCLLTDFQVKPQIECNLKLQLTIMFPLCKNLSFSDNIC